LWKDGHLQRIDLQPLSDAEVAGMVRGALPDAVSGEVVRWVQERSLGYPLFVVELVRGAVWEGVLRVEGGEWGFACVPRPPQRMRELIDQRLACLEAADRHGLEVLAFGEPLAHEVALAVIGEASLQSLEEHGLAQAATTDDGSRLVRLAHPLYGEVALAGVGRVRRDGIARRLAGALLEEDRRGAPEVLRAVSWLLEAGERVGVPQLLEASAAAGAVFDPSLALRYARRAHAAAGTVETALAVASPLLSLARFAEVEALLAPYEGQESSEEQAGMVLGLRVYAMLLGLGHIGEAVAVLDRYTVAYRTDAWRRRMREVRITLTTYAGRLSEACELLREMLADPTASDKDFRHVFSGAYALVSAGDLEAARRFAERVLKTPDAPAPDEVEVLVWFAVHSPTVGSDQAEDVLEPILDQALRAHNIALAGVCAHLLGTVALDDGRVLSAQRRFEEAARLLGAQDPFGMQLATLTRLAEARALKRNLAGARDALSAAERMLADRATTWVEETHLARARIRIALAQDRPVQAQHMALAGAARMGQVITRRAILLHEALRAGAPAAQVVRGLQQLAARCDSPRVAACAEHAAASARRDGEALEHAAERFEQIGAVLHAAEVRAEAAAAHAANGNRPRAVAAAETSRRLANHCQGAWTPTLKLADAAINNLTPREAQVAALATRGLTNAQIAERLTLSTRTIDSHLQRIYTKLGINRRERLTEILTLD
jgi:DNA-binding NarL/FixJ family response regulator/tetratricopeptide (TPR) repeat protein